MQLLLAHMTARNPKEARAIADHLLRKKLAACVNIIDAVESHYVWEGKRCKDNEVLVLAKTKKSLAKKFVAAVKDVHSYECPCIVFVPIVGGNEDYLQWTRKKLGT